MRIEVCNISAGYGGRTVLHDVSLGFDTREIVGILGPNGSGKSTLLKVLNGSLAASSGQVKLNDEPMSQMDRRQRARWMATVPQQPSAPDGLTVRQLVACGRTPHLRWLSPIDAHGRAVIEAAVDRCELGELLDRPVAQLSGGERQRAWIAMALAQEPRFLLLDEPTAALDIGHQLDVMHLLDYLVGKRDMAIIVVIHDINLAMRFCRQIVLLDEGRLVGRFDTDDPQAEAAIAQVFGVRTSRLADAAGIPGRQLCFQRATD